MKLVKGAEGWFSCWYKDPVGLPTIGYGHLIEKGDSYKKGSCLTKEQGDALLKKDLGKAEDCIRKQAKVPLNCNEFSALTSWAFNVGCGASGKSGVMRQLNTGNRGAVCGELSKWNKGGGKELKGLTTRRRDECSLFKSGGGSC